MKKIIFIFSLILILSSVTVYANITEKPNINIVINETKGIYSDVPIILDGRTLLPLRQVLINLGVQDDSEHIIWNNTEKTITINKDSIKIYLKIGDYKAQLNGIEKQIDSNNIKVVPVIYKNRTYIPARFIAESFGMNVDWNQGTQTVTINNKGSDITPMPTPTKGILTASMPSVKLRDVEQIKYKDCEACKYNSITYIRFDSFQDVYLDKYYCSWTYSTRIIIIYDKADTKNIIKEFESNVNNTILVNGITYIRSDLLNDLMN